MAVIQKGASNYPFWGAPINLITGLDPLSLQTTSEATYATMLPGISNLTNRLRYYGFYCWLLDFYFKKEKRGNAKEQYKFIRRAELMIAIIMQSDKPDVLQITGSNFAADLIKNQTKNYFDLAKGAAEEKENKEKVYWKYSSGAFGQYYYGPLRSLSLVVAAENIDKDIIYSITKQHPRQKVAGVDLANTFDASLTDSVKDIFYISIKSGTLYSESIPELIKYFAIDKIQPSTDEWKLYLDMLLDKDEPAQEDEDKITFHRKETIQELIQSAVENEGNYNWYSLLLKAYSLKMGSSDVSVSETLKGWYAYKFNEYFQYANGSIFWGTLQYLHNLHKDQYLPLFVKQLAKELSSNLCQEIQNVKPESLLKELIQNLNEEDNEEVLYEMIETNSNSNPIEAAKNGLLLLFRLYQANVELLLPLKEFMNRKQMLREGNMIDGLLSLQKSLDDTVQNFIEQFLLRKIIYRHQMVAIRKMGNGFQSTHKFIIEDQYIRLIATFSPRSTSPRMNALKNLLSDLKIIGEEDKLLSIYKKIIAE